MISKFSVKKPFTVLVAVILVLVLGTVSVTRMTPDLLPEMSFPYIVLVTTYVGAAPEEVENTVSKPLEQSLAALDDLKEISSVSSENVSVVYLTFEDTVNVDRAMLDIQQVVTKLKGDWPEAVGNPTSLELSTDLIPTVVAAVHYKDMDPVDLSSFVKEKLVPALEGTNGVASVNATGLVAEKIGIASQMLGAGRAKKEDKIDPAVGLIMHKRVGDALSTKEPFCTLYVNDETHLEEAVALLHESMTISTEKPEPSPLVYAIVKE